jgi:tRNA pseudouridine32 synthase/23S rRNA pseudouridine746 synthase
MAKYLATAFRESRVVKYYTGLSANKATKKKQGWIKGGMERGRRKSWLLTKERTNYAKTRFFTKGVGHWQEDLVDTDPESSLKTMLLMRPYTGKTHQLRVAAKSIGMPLAGTFAFDS